VTLAASMTAPATTDTSPIDASSLEIRLTRSTVPPVVRTTGAGPDGPAPRDLRVLLCTSGPSVLPLQVLPYCYFRSFVPVGYRVALLAPPMVAVVTPWAVW